MSVYKQTLRSPYITWPVGLAQSKACLPCDVRSGRDKTHMKKMDADANRSTDGAAHRPAGRLGSGCCPRRRDATPRTQHQHHLVIIINWLALESTRRPPFTSPPSRARGVGSPHQSPPRERREPATCKRTPKAFAAPSRPHSACHMVRARWCQAASHVLSSLDGILIRHGKRSMNCEPAKIKMNLKNLYKN